MHTGLLELVRLQRRAEGTDSAGLMQQGDWPLDVQMEECLPHHGAVPPPPADVCRPAHSTEHGAVHAVSKAAGRWFLKLTCKRLTVLERKLHNKLDSRFI
ncbi:unnamed protein product [Pleuronectes platessa]|uniref:Uncharacterized protein n=1 Tax=Pleuronectes platessa TaxID=8262 RepID=A0A9N7VSJ0_PLEPL|nr:unnamed protein product [Pleuronectes platessa]